MNTYKALFIFSSSLTEDDTEKALGRVKEELEKLGGEILGKNVLGKRSFVRTMQKKDNGVFIDIGIKLDPANVASFKVRLKLIEGIFRVQITRKIEKAKDEVAA